MSKHPRVVIDPAKASIYDNAPPGAIMPWKRGTEPHPGWEWADDLEEYDAGDWCGEPGTTYGWVRRVEEGEEPRRILAVLYGTLPREHGIETIICPECGLDAETTPCTQEERNEVGCGKPYDCCSITFACDNGHRTALRIAAPEPGW